MRRILVPLDGSHLAESILPDARRVAGPGGELVLIRDVSWIRYDPTTGGYSYRLATEEAEHYLENVAEKLRQENVKVTVHCQTAVDVARAVDAAALDFKVDMVACATHGRGPLSRFLSGGVAWRLLTNSRLPVLLRHVDGTLNTAAEEPRQRRIMVPLDGSDFAEAALPLAQSLASESGASLRLVRVVQDHSLPAAPLSGSDTLPSTLEVEDAIARAYLAQIARRLPGKTHIEVLAGKPIVEQLAQTVEDCAITDVVMASHGRTGLARVVVGSVADELIHRLPCPIVIVPMLAIQRLQTVQTARAEEVPVVPR